MNYDELRDFYQHAIDAGFVAVCLSRRFNKMHPDNGWQTTNRDAHRTSQQAVHRLRQGGWNVGVGIPKHRTDLVILDLDSPGAVRWCAERKMPPTLSIKTPRGHAGFYRMPEGMDAPKLTESVTDAASDAGKLGTRIGGQYEVGPGSCLNTDAYVGKEPPAGEPPWFYRVARCCAVATLPDGLAKELCALADSSKTSPAADNGDMFTMDFSVPPSEWDWSEGGRHDLMVRGFRHFSEWRDNAKLDEVEAAALDAGKPEREVKAARKYALQRAAKFLASGGRPNQSAKSSKNAPAPEKEDELGEPLATASDPSSLRAPDWLWEGWLPKSNITLCAGPPAAGKGTLMAWIAKCVIRGEWPDGFKSEPGRVMMHSREDDFNEQTLARLLATGLTDDEIHAGILSLTPEAMSELPRLGRQFAAGFYKDVVAVVFDDLAEGMPIDSSDNSAKDVQAYLMAMTDLAREHNLAIVGCRHTNKSKSLADGLSSWVQGSGKWVGAPRMSWTYLPWKNCKDDPNRRILVRNKSNLPCDWWSGGWLVGGDGGRYVRDVDGKPVKASVADKWTWDGKTAAEDLAVKAAGGSGTEGDGRKANRNIVKETIEKYLKGAPRTPQDVVAYVATRAQTSESAVWRAQKELVQYGRLISRKPTDKEKAAFDPPPAKLWELVQRKPLAGEVDAAKRDNDNQSELEF